MRFVTFAEFHVEATIRNQNFNDARKALEQSSCIEFLVSHCSWV